jgi:hypothetical protein
MPLKHIRAENLHGNHNDLVMLLKNAMACGELKIAEGSGVRESLAAVRLSADGKVDPKTVNGTVRATALPAAAAKANREMKKVSLRDVQSHYFEILDQFFGQPFSELPLVNSHAHAYHPVA